MNLLGPELVRDLVSLIQSAEADPKADLFAELVVTPSSPARIGAALERGSQTRAAELDLARLLGELPDK